jgi:hypothetical protein
MRIALFWIALAGCYAPDPPEGIPCGADTLCPDPLICSFGSCVAEPGPCTPIEAGAGKLTIPMLHSPITLDGVLDDWPTCFVSVDQQSAGLVRDLGAGGKFTPGRFSIAADADRVYLAAEVQSVLPLGEHDVPDVYLNNAISVYFDGDGTFKSATYDPDAAQIVVDHANRHAEFNTADVAGVPDLATAAKVGDTTFTIEMSVQPSTFGLSAFGSSIGFDIGLVGGNGTNMTSELVWFVACRRPECGCSGTDAAPYCDAREFGLATFAR